MIGHTKPAAIIPTSFAGKRVLVVGLGRFGGGVGVTRWLVGQGARVTVTDRAPADTLKDSVDAISGLGVRLRLGTHDPRDLDAIDVVVLNPAVRKQRCEFFKAIEQREIPWTTEINLFCERCRAQVIGVTGTFGKSTTCAMIAEALRACSDSTVHLGGNIGGSLLGDLAEMRANDIVVFELSNAQLEDLPRIPWTPRVAVITNLYPHHLDRYDSFEAYIDAKLNIVRAPGDSGRESRDAVRDAGHAHRVIVGPMDPIAEAKLQAILNDKSECLERVQPLPETLDLSIPGRHNQDNAACALTVCRFLGLDTQVARDAVARFAGLPHRLQFARTVDGADYYNDSKATSPTATLASVNAFDQSVIAIIGGTDSTTGVERWAASLVQACRGLVCFGEAGPRVARAARDAAMLAGRSVFVDESADLPDAVRQAQIRARGGDVVLFSPGAPSFDAYANYEARGNHFAALVRALPS